MKDGANTLAFGNDGQSCWVIFSDKPEGTHYENKEEAIRGVMSFYKEAKITETEKMKFIGQILHSEQLLWGSNKSMVSKLVVLMINLPKFISQPYFKECKCGEEKPHGYFYNGENKPISPLIKTLKEFEDFVEYILGLNKINEAQASVLSLQIKQLKSQSSAVV